MSELAISAHGLAKRDTYCSCYSDTYCSRYGYTDSDGNRNTDRNTFGNANIDSC